MKINFTRILIIPALFLSVSLVAQETTVYHPTTIKTPVYFGISPPLRDMQQIAPAKKEKFVQEVPNKVGRKEFFGIEIPPFTLPEDPVWQKQDGTYMPANATPIQNFDGITATGVYPPDTQGDVGPNHYVQNVNRKYAIYDKSGSLLLGPSNMNTIWTGIPAPWLGTNNGDPIVMYDQVADRWFISQFSLPNTTQYAILIAVSVTSDPTGSWYQYVYEYGNQMPDYPKFGVWPDGYYMSVNQFTGGASWGGVSVAVFERDQMLVGNPAAQWVNIELGTSSPAESMLPSDWDGTVAPPAGAPNYFTYMATDALKIYTFTVDWVTPANTVFAFLSSLTTAAFDQTICTAYRGRCIDQPGTCTAVKLESLSDRLMYRLQYWNYGTHQAMVTNHSVDVGSSRAGVRWYELRNTGSGWSIYQQGTYAPTDGLHRWMGSIALNSVGDIALGYTVSDGSTTFPGIRYTGRRATDPLGMMTVSEQTVINGTGCQTGSAARWGDYSMMSVDPVDNTTFWYTTEYIQSTGTANWRTRITSFLFDDSPTIITNPASLIGTAFATLNGSVNANGYATSYHFEWGTTTSYGNSTPTTSAGSGTALNPVTYPLTGLSPATMYHCRLVGVSSEGTSYGSDQSFTTDCPPTAIPYLESFPGTTIPVCWSQVDHQGGGDLWEFGAPSWLFPAPVLTGNYAYLDSDGYGSGRTQNVDLVSPVFDLSAYSAITLSFLHVFRVYAVETGTVSYSIDNGSTWVPFAIFASDSPNPEAMTYDLPAVAGQSQVKFKWNYFGSYGWFWAVDDVQLTGIPTVRSLNNITVGNQTTSCYNAFQTIRVAETGPFLVENGGNVTFIAGQNIFLMPGTTVESGGYLWAYISTQFCTNPTVAPQNPVNLELFTSEEPLSETTLFKIYPNPTPGKFTLELTPDASASQAHVAIYGMTGELILQETINQGPVQGFKKEFSLDDRPSGIYIIRVISGKNSNAAKIVRQ